MAASVPSASVLDREFLGVRCRLIELAAALDRLDRAGGASDDPRRQQIRRGIERLLAESPHRASQVQMEFSLPYEEHWQNT